MTQRNEVERVVDWLQKSRLTGGWHPHPDTTLFELNDFSISTMSTTKSLVRQRTGLRQCLDERAWSDNPAYTPARETEVLRENVVPISYQQTRVV